MVASLMQDFVPEPFVKDMDFSTLDPFPTERVTRGFSQRYGDTIWRLNWKNSPCYLFLMLEFQSSVHPFMPVRVLVYSALLWQYLINQGSLKQGDKLPPVFPIVLYNGKQKWKAASDIQSLLSPMPRGLNEYQPSQKFFLIDENALSQKMLDAAKGVSANLFRLERLKGGDSVARVLCDVVADLHTYSESLRQTFDTWILLFLKQRKIIKSDTKYLQIKGDHTMFGEALKEWEESLLRKGEKRGEKRGEKNGIAKNEANVIADMKDLLLSMVRDRFEKVPKNTAAAIRGVNLRSTLKDLISAVYQVKDITAFNALLNSKLTSQE